MKRILSKHRSVRLITYFCVNFSSITIGMDYDFSQNLTQKIIIGGLVGFFDALAGHGSLGKQHMVNLKSRYSGRSGLGAWKLLLARHFSIAPCM